MRIRSGVRIIGLSLAAALLLADQALAGSGHFWKETNFQGQKLNVHGEKAALGDWGNRISSYRIDANTECVVCKSSRFEGEHLYLEAGSSAAEMPPGWNNRISSIKCAKKGYFTKNPLAQGKGAAYEHPHFAGKVLHLNTHTQQADLTGREINNRISSIRLGPGIECECFKAKNYTPAADTLKLGPEASENRLNEEHWANKITSIRCWAAGESGTGETSQGTGVTERSGTGVQRKEK